MTASDDPYESRVTGPVQRQLERLPPGTAAAVVEFMVTALIENPHRDSSPAATGRTVEAAAATWMSIADLIGRHRKPPLCTLDAPVMSAATREGNCVGARAGPRIAG